jgi:hypothetical protein
MKMSQPNHTHPSPDDLLADFTDRVLAGKTSGPASPADAELRGLEETVLRLQRTLPQTAPDEKVLRRMQADFKVRARKAGISTPPSWPLLRPRQRFALAFAGMVLAALLVAYPFLASTGEPIEGTAGFQTQALIVLAGIGCVIGLLIWARRRK